ncbi:MAG: chemotaxis protein, partial [Alphaproteobacteria bacterium]
MSSFVSPAETASDYVAGIDPDGTIARNAKEIGLLIEPDIDQVAAAFFDSYMRETGLIDRLAQSVIDKIRAESRVYAAHKLMHFREARWTRSAADCVRHARKHGV